MSLDDSSYALSTPNNRIDYIDRQLALAKLIAQPRKSGQGKQGSRQSRIPPQDELAQYLSEPPIDNTAYSSDPIAWWRDVGAGRFPRLSYMAVDFLTIASSSAETERDFSSAGRMTTPLRNRLRHHIISMAQCLQSWSKAGVYTPSIPLDLLEGDAWRTVLASLANDTA